MQGQDSYGQPVESVVNDKSKLAGLAFKLWNDKFVGRLVFFRVYTGQLKQGMALYNPRTRRSERCSRLVLMRAIDREEIDVAYAGDICALVGIKDVITQAHTLLRSGGIAVLSMMAPTCWYARYIAGDEGDFKIVRLDTPRQKGERLINFKEQSELAKLFAPFKPLHVGSYGSHIRQEEGSTDHWLYVGVKA